MIIIMLKMIMGMLKGKELTLKVKFKDDGKGVTIDIVE